MKMKIPIVPGVRELTNNYETIKKIKITKNCPNGIVFIFDKKRKK